MERIGQYELGRTEHTGRSREVPWGRRTQEQGGFPGRSRSTKAWVLYGSSWGGLVSNHKEPSRWMRLWKLLVIEKKHARSFLENGSRCQMSLWFKCWILPCTQCLVFSQLIWKRGLKILEVVEPCWGRWGVGQETREGDTVVPVWECTSPAFKGHSSQCYEIQRFLLEWKGFYNYWTERW